ncbi:MAG: abortive infection family protein [Bacteroidales bacterium]|jgi:hypothetical protein|nr:abortive infection family protein [Bacteroidales bacterium]MCI2146068.1 abortive infection family protein [Bacteroidales bacterium]
MSLLTRIEKGALLKLFNRGGYVLDFSTSDFDAFTMESVGVALCDKYQMSKGRSLNAFIGEAKDEDATKLLIDLFKYYEFTYQKEIEGDNEYVSIYKRCKPIIERVHQQITPAKISVESLKRKFSNDYISSQITLMVDMQKENPTEAIGKAKELIESCCETILENNHIVPDKKWNVGKLVDETVKLLKVTPNDIPDDIPEATAMKAILGNLKAIAINVATLRNAYGSGHGKSASYKGLEERHAKLAVGSSVTLVNFLWDSYERQNS